MEEPTYLVCLPVINNPDGQGLAAGSIKNKCSECGGEVWMAPSGQQLIAQGSVIICIPCAMKKAKEQGEFHLMKPTPEQAEEIRHATRKNKYFPDSEMP